MNTIKFEQILDQCLGRIQAGEPLQAVLADYPAQAERLRPLLKAARLGSQMPRHRASDQVRSAAEARLLQEFERMKNQANFGPAGTKPAFSRYSNQLWTKLTQFIGIKENFDMKLAPRLAVYALITVLAAGFFTVNASASSLPGDPLYGLKRGWEQARMTFTFSDPARQELESELEEERREEVNSLLSDGRSAEVEYYGVIEEKTDSGWLIGGYQVQIGPDTELKGALEIGTRVKVEALTQEDGSLLAVEIYLDLDEDMMDDSSDDDEMDDSSDDDEMDDSSDDDEMDDSSDDDSEED
jgi:hypothetical protein